MVTSLFLTEKIGYPGKADTQLIIRESVKRFSTFAFDASELFIENGRVKAISHKVYVDESGALAQEDASKIIDLSDNCIITIRLNPPFDSGYLSAMYMLAQVGGTSQVINDPTGIINMPEKFIPDELVEFAPKTLMTRNIAQIMEFWKEHGDIVVKPLYEFGGRGVFRLQKNEENYKTILQFLQERYNEPLIAQKYVPEVKKGDKRIALLNGEIFGQFLRIPPEGQLQAAVLQGGAFIRCEITDIEKEICARLKPILLKNGIFLCGIDMLGDYLTEINVTCPAIFYCMNELYKNDKAFVPSEITYWEALESKLKSPTSRVQL